MSDNKTIDISGLLSIAALLSYLAMMLMLLWQCFQYLKVGSWPDWPLLGTLYNMGWVWAAYPDSWFGVHKILANTSTPSGIGLLGALLYILSLMTSDYKG